MKTIALLTGNHICSQPRALKEADALSAAGYHVEWLGGWLDDELKSRDIDLLRDREWNFTPVIDLTTSARSLMGTNLLSRAEFRLAREIHARIGRESFSQLGYGVRQLLAAARSCNADLYIAHTESGLYVADRLRKRGYSVGIDFEDWFSEDLLPEECKRRPLKILRHLECNLLKHARHATCPSEVMSQALAERYSCEKPVVVYNAFPWEDRSKLDGIQRDNKSANMPSLHWFSQTIGKGRGLEILFQSLQFVTSRFEIHLRGKVAAETKKWIEESVPPDWFSRLIVHPPVPNDELPSRIAEHDIGFAGEMTYCTSRQLTVTNKILQYLVGGLAVVASDTPGQREISHLAPGAINLFEADDPRALAAAIDNLVCSCDGLRRAQSHALQAAENNLSWEICVEPFLESVERGLAIQVTV